MGPYATADVTFSLPGRATFSLALTSFHPNGTLFFTIFEYNATHTHGSIFSEHGRFLVHKNYPHAPFPSGLNTWSFISYPDGFACFFNHQEHFRLSDSQEVFLANISSLQISGATIVNASLGRLVQPASSRHSKGRGQLPQGEGDRTGLAGTS